MKPHVVADVTRESIFPLPAYTQIHGFVKASSVMYRLPLSTACIFFFSINSIGLIVSSLSLRSNGGDVPRLPLSVRRLLSRCFLPAVCLR